MRHITWLLFASVFACTTPKSNQEPSMQVAGDITPLMELPLLSMEKDSLYDKVLGMLVGSAIGDAMGAPTEMWSRYNIQVEYGHVDGLDPMVREPSPEGTWDFNLPAGGTTDDTRWKLLLSDYLLLQGDVLYRQEGANPYTFAQFIVRRYKSEIQQLKQTDSFNPIPFEDQARRMAWLQEWAMVAKPFAEKDLEAYSEAVNRFYGGEMTCAGMLYSPMLGLVYPGNPELAYQSGYRLGFFDLGYARDITALTATLVAAAMDPSATPETMVNSLRDTDPKHYFNSRLVGRASYRIYREALYLTHEAKSMTEDQVDPSTLQLPLSGRTPLRVAQIQRAYELLDNKNQDMPFHAGEIHLINLSALLFCNFEFLPALEFVINYGRDNDTVGAITGSILGAYHGYAQLPPTLSQKALKVNKEKLGIDLEKMAGELTEMMVENGIIIPLP
ncbi:MAG: ADP-ribosylglycohydrolase family protein [Bacteroidota bacterium]